MFIHLMEDTNTSKDKKVIKSRDELNKIKSDYFLQKYVIIYQERNHLKYLNIIKIYKKE